jgi:hypothetical protein
MCSFTSMINYQVSNDWMSDPFVRYIRGIRFDCIRCDLEYAHSIVYFSLPQSAVTQMTPWRSPPSCQLARFVRGFFPSSDMFVLHRIYSSSSPSR